MKKKILLKALMPLVTLGVTVGVVSSLASCSCNSNDDQPTPPIGIIGNMDGTNWPGYGGSGTLTCFVDTAKVVTIYDGYSYEAINLIIPDFVTDGTNTYSVAAIGTNAFKNCSSITGSLTIPNSISSIYDNAFQDCTSLTSFIVGDNICHIRATAFSGCIGLIDTSGNIVQNKISQSGDNVYYLWNGTVSYCVGKGSNIDSGITIEPSGQLFLRNDTRSFWFNALENCTSLNGNLTIPNSVIFINNNVFHNCSSLTGGLIIPNSVTTIGANAFLGCSGLTDTLTIGNAASIIGTSAFENCSGFTSIVGNFSSQPITGVNVFKNWRTSGGPCTVKNNNSSYTSAQLCTFLKTKDLPSNWQPAQLIVDKQDINTSQEAIA